MPSSGHTWILISVLLTATGVDLNCSETRTSSNGFTYPVGYPEDVSLYWRRLRIGNVDILALQFSSMIGRSLEKIRSRWLE